MLKEVKEKLEIMCKKGEMILKINGIRKELNETL